MPQENRKRGKKHKKNPHNEGQEVRSQPEDLPEEPKWILPSVKSDDSHDPEAPFGELDADIKAYFRTVDVQIRDWQEDGEQEEDVQPDDKKRMFFMAALNEMHGKEKQLATDPECSMILERLLYSMDDYVLRVFVDSLTGSYDVLSRHRFASHVCQTLFAVTKDMIQREGMTPYSSIPSDQGELRSLTQLIVDICEEIMPNITSLLTHPFASHVTRSLLTLLSPNLDFSEDTIRSRKSATWKARQEQLTSFFDEKKKGKGNESLSKDVFRQFKTISRDIIEAIRNELSDNEVRVMAADKVACPMLKLLLEVEAELSMSNELDSLMDRVTVGAVTACLNKTPSDVTKSDYLGTLIRDPNASHLLETVVSRCSDEVFDIIWKTYFDCKLAKLAVHPVANFVVAKALVRVSESQLSRALEELSGVWETSIQMFRTGVMRAVIDRVSVLHGSGIQNVPEIVLSGFGFQKSDVEKLLVHCILTVQPLSEYQKLKQGVSTEEARSSKRHDRNSNVKGTNSLGPKIQGSLLLQSLLRLPETLNQFVIASVLGITVEERIKIAQDVSGSRVFDAFLESVSVPISKKRQLVMDLIGHYHYLVDDKIGSRVGDRCWEFSDTYLKEKIARSLIPKESELAASFYGKFFARNLNLHMLRRRPEEWRNLQSKRRQQEQLNTIPQTDELVLSPVRANNREVGKEKRKKRADEIDVLFDERLGKKAKIKIQ